MGKVVQSLLVLLALVLIATLICVQIILYGAGKDSWKLWIPSFLASVVVVLVVYVVSKTILRSPQAILTDAAVSELSDRIVHSVELAAGARQWAYSSLHRWYALPWGDLLAEASEVDVVASYMDTWVNHVSDHLRDAFTRGCIVRLYLPQLNTDAARRVRARFPEYDAPAIESKIRNTPQKIQALRGAAPRKGRLQVWWTSTFCMWCLVLIDNRWLIIDPFDHFRRGQIEGPAFVIDLEQNPEWRGWADKELVGFRETGTKQTL